MILSYFAGRTIVLLKMIVTFASCMTHDSLSVLRSLVFWVLI